MIYSNFRGGLNSDKVKKAKLYQQNMAKGKEKYRQESISKWSEEDHKNWNRLLKIRDIYISLITNPVSKNDRKDIGKLVSDIQFVSNQIYSSCNEWGKPLSAKQIDCVTKAEEAINRNAELLI